jgi:hypothetical protein
MDGERRLSDPALLRDQCDGEHVWSPTIPLVGKHIGCAGCLPTRSSVYRTSATMR